MSASILQIDRLVKSFRSHWSFRATEAVKDVSLEVYRGESFGFLGHNGAGKTTTLKCVVGLLRKTSGRIFYDGELMEKPALHRHIGYLPELPYFYDHLTVQETLDFFASLHGMSRAERKLRIDEVLERVGLADRRRSAVRALSKGLQQRLGFAQAILNRPALLLLDEPFSGLDPAGRREMRELILELKAQGATILLSSHILSDVEEICDRVSIMAKGVLKSVFYLKDIPSLFGELFELRYASNDEVQVVRFDSSEKANQALATLTATGARIISFQSLGLRLEDIFLKITAESGVGAHSASHAAPEKTPEAPAA